MLIEIMKSITSILPPTDFSASALNAYRYALHLAEALDARIDLMYTIPPTTTSPGYGTFINTLTTTIQREASRDLKQFKEKGLTEVARELARKPRTLPGARHSGKCQLQSDRIHLLRYRPQRHDHPPRQ